MSGAHDAHTRTSATLTLAGARAAVDAALTQAAEPAVRDGIAGREGVAAFGGGVPVVVDGELVGAVGASGGSAAQDKQVAQAGADAVR